MRFRCSKIDNITLKKLRTINWSDYDIDVPENDDYDIPVNENDDYDR